MSIVTKAKAMKEVHPDYVIFYKVGLFYQCLGKDAYILTYLFNYRLSKNKEDIYVCGFPEKAIFKVKSKLEDLKLNYMLVDTRNNYDVDEKFDNKNLNKYDEIFQKAKMYVRKKNRIDKICETLLQDIDKEDIKDKLLRIEKVIYEE